MAAKWFNSLDTNSSQWPLHILIMQPEQWMKVCMYKYVNYYVHCTYYMGTTIYLMSSSVLDVIVTIVEKFHGQNNYCFACRFFGWFFLGISFCDSLFFWLRGLLLRSSIWLERFCMKLIWSCFFFTGLRLKSALSKKEQDKSLLKS